MFKPIHLSPSLAISSLALFVSLGGTGYAISTIKGSSIATNSIPGNRLKSNSLTGTQIKESSLAVVPSATHAVSADSASSATNAVRATAADSATSATNAVHATTADSATAATTAATASSLAGLDLATIRYAAPPNSTPAVILSDFDGLTLSAQCGNAANGLTLTAQAATAGSAIGIAEIHPAGNGAAQELDQPALTSGAPGTVIIGSAPAVSGTTDATGEIVFQEADPSPQVKGGTVTIDYLYTAPGSSATACTLAGNVTGHPGA